MAEQKGAFDEVGEVLEDTDFYSLPEKSVPDDEFYAGIEVKETEKEEEIQDEEPAEVLKTQKDPEWDNEENADSILPFAEAFYEKVGWDVKDLQLEDDSLDGFIDHIKSIVEQDSVPEYANDFTKGLDEYVRAGGNPQDYFNLYYGEGNNIDSINLESEDIQKQLVERYYRETTKWSDSKIEKEIAKRELDGDLKDISEEAYEYLKEAIEEQRNNAKAELEFQQQEYQKQVQEGLNNLKNLIHKGTVEELGFELSKGERKDFEDFVFKVGKSGKTKYQETLEQIPNSEIKLAILAFKGALNQQTVNKATEKKVVKNLVQQLNKVATNSSGVNSNSNRGVKSSQRGAFD